VSAEPEVLVEESATALADRVADRAIATLSAAIAERGGAHLVVTGGGILEKVLSALAARKPIDWSQVDVWWGDERFVPADSADRNDQPAFTALFDHVPVDPAKVHRMPASGAQFGDNAEAAAAAYASELATAAPEDAAVPTFDLVLLGVGPDGHCASLFPGHPALQESSASVIAVHNSPKPPPTRLSLTYPALAAANEIWFVASGDGKADAVARAVGGADYTEVPSARPRGREHTLWLLDRDAAADLG
jgi:6-phosphogluconolactonase